MLNLPPSDADRIELRGALEEPDPQLPPEEELYRIALECRPDVASFRLGVDAAREAYRLARANQFADAYLLYQPFTYQNNAPFGTQSATSWALGITVPLPVYNRNQGNIERARINIHQSEVQLADRQRQVIFGGPAGPRRIPDQRPDRRRDPRGSAAGPEARHRRPRYPDEGGEVDVFRLLDQTAELQRPRQGLCGQQRPASQGDADSQHGGGAAHPAVRGGIGPLDRESPGGRPEGIEAGRALALHAASPGLGKVPDPPGSGSAIPGPADCGLDQCSRDQIVDHAGEIGAGLGQAVEVVLALATGGDDAAVAEQGEVVADGGLALAELAHRAPTCRSPSARIRITWRRVGSLTCLSRMDARRALLNLCSTPRYAFGFGATVLVVVAALALDLVAGWHLIDLLSMKHS